MKKYLAPLAAVLFGLAQAVFAADDSLSRVEVVYVQPDNFTDADYRNLDEFTRHLRRHADRYVAPGRQLTVTITDIDMAGRFEPWRTRANHVRIVRDVYPPRIDLRFRLVAADGVVIAEGERKLRDPAFLMTTVLHRSDPLRYEKALLDNWLEREWPRQVM